MVAQEKTAMPFGSRLLGILAAFLPLQTGLGAMPSLDPKTQTSLTSMLAIAGTPTIDTKNITNNANHPNVQRVMSIVPQAKFDEFFPPGVRLPVYTYEGFLQAMAKFPALCDETSAKYTKDEACRRTLATVFAHFRQEVQKLQFVDEVGCSSSTCKGYSAGCDTWPEPPGWYPCMSENGYYGRGAKQLSYTYNYGAFSWVMFADRTVLLKNPERLSSEGYLAFASAMWFTVTPQSPKPSIHEVATGLWQPNAADLNAGIMAGFGATINIINGAVECGTATPQAANRVEYYKYYAQQLGIDISQEQLDCASMKPFPPDGTGGAVLSYWAEDWTISTPACKLVNYQTRYPLQMGNVSYELCVCRKFQIPEADCQPANNAIAQMKALVPTSVVAATTQKLRTTVAATNPIVATITPILAAATTTNNFEGASVVTAADTGMGSSPSTKEFSPTAGLSVKSVSSGAWRLQQWSGMQVAVVVIAHVAVLVMGYP